MDKIKVIGGNTLEGKIYISGAKNAALPLICASLLTEKEVILKNVPKLSDITFLNSLLEFMGLKVSKKEEEYKGTLADTFIYKADEIKELIAPYDFVRKMRASY
jgi:UDP-N-acetylglucosamine 1-carboxyvinyltransferase